MGIISDIERRPNPIGATDDEVAAHIAGIVHCWHWPLLEQWHRPIDVLLESERE